MTIIILNTERIIIRRTNKIEEEINLQVLTARLIFSNFKLLKFGFRTETERILI